LEGLKSFVHFVGDEKVANKIINNFQALYMLGENGLLFMLLKLSLL
jgi:hypothetical protein